MGLKWTDSQDIAIALNAKYPDIDPRFVRFTDLHKWIVDIEGFDDEAARSGERLLEAIQAAWIREAELD